MPELSTNNSTSQNNGGNANGGQGAGGDANNNGGQQNGNQNGGNTNQNQTGQGDFDVNKALESKELWAHPRLKELTEAAAELKKIKTDKAAADDKALEDQKKFQELADKRGNELTEAQNTIKQMRVDQALTNKLVGEKVVDLDGALKLIDRSKIEVGDDGSVSGIDTALEALKKDKAYLFTAGGQTTVGTASNTNNNGGQSGPAKFKRSQLADQKFYQEHRTEILAAAKAGLIEDDIGPSSTN